MGWLQDQTAADIAAVEDRYHGSGALDIVETDKLETGKLGASDMRRHMCR